MNPNVITSKLMTMPASGRMTFWFHSKEDRYAPVRQRKFVVGKLGYKKAGHSTYEKLDTTIRGLLDDARLFVQHLEARPSAARIGDFQIMATVGEIPLISADLILEMDLLESEASPLKLALAA